jgi:hypothetical protein
MANGRRDPIFRLLVLVVAAATLTVAFFALKPVPGVDCSWYLHPPLPEPTYMELRWRWLPPGWECTYIGVESRKVVRTVKA